jgi:ATP-dependent Clp protease ATP-binding subunit ClpC
MGIRIEEDVRSSRPGQPIQSRRSAPADGRPVRERLNAGCITDQTRGLDETLRRHIIGQDAVIGALTCSYSRVLSGMRDPDRPALTLLLLGPTGVGKTETARVLADAVFGSRHALTQINCEEYAQGHEVSKLLGSPPGYVGHQLEPLLSQRRIDEAYVRAVRARTGIVGQLERNTGLSASKDEPPLSVILFDEIEKAHPAVWNAMLGILEDGRLTLGDNTTTDFTQSIVLMTSNVGSREMTAAIEKPPLGFRGSEPSPVDVKQTALAAARGLFPLEFLNRFDEVLVYRPLDHEQLERVFEKFLSELHVRALRQAGVPMLIRISADARAAIIARGTDMKLGARPLRRAVEAELVDPLSRLIAAHQIAPGDVIEVEREGDRLGFYRTRAETTLVLP